MATNLPQNLPDLINWVVSHADTWKTAPTTIGLSVLQSTDFERVAGDLAARSKEAQAARDASKAATEALHDAVTVARAQAGLLIGIIKSYAVSTGSPNVYVLAQISPDAPRGTVPPPVPPTSINATINPDGSLRLKFKAAQPLGVTGVTYTILRRLGTTPPSPFIQIGSTGSSKTFIDTTLPFGVDRVDYIIQPIRSTGAAGEQSNIFSLQFGSVGGGGGPGLTITSTTELPNEDVKLAA